ncbi:hypothetical protein [Lysinibacillus sp. SGAir0095]|uniref:hypothetical protein n=1 Tax=Lysinibacillus sp. SGAir0095 TaxID=2070463 RepID=UPI0010CCB990|nr:hypothetical protein [Lysinibacillus sp. SGAir0095]QCR33105.1 hypothetical protein C1N55_13355 [Lysinibacillus sp. SGAir0095]
MISVIKPNYLFAKLKPNNSIRNTNTHLISKTISTMHRSIFSNFRIVNHKQLKLFRKELFIPTKFEFSLVGKISFFIYMEKEKIEFYFIFPDYIKKIFEEKMSAVWNQVTIEYIEESNLPQFLSKATKYQMDYVKEDGLSLHTNRTSNELLNATLNVVEVLETGDKVGVFYNFVPTSQNSFRHSYARTIDKVKKGVPVERNKTGLAYIFKMFISILDGVMKDITEILAGKDEKKAEENVLDALLDKLNGGKRISESTEKKGRGQILESQVLVLSESKTKVREISYATSIADAFEVIAADNKFTKKSYKKDFKYTDTRFPGASINKVYDEEVQNFINLPGRELIERYSFMDRIDTQETQIPKDIQSGSICIGEVTYRGHKQKAYLSNDEQFKKLMLLLIGPTRAGKSKLMANLSKDAIDNGECVIVFDFIKKCELSDEIASCFPKEKVLEISCADFEKIQGIGYNEVGFSTNPFKQYENAKRQTSNTLTLINSINDTGDNSRLTPKMERYLESACLVVYISTGSLKDVFAVLLNHETRHNFISRVPEKQKEFLSEYMDSLFELDDKNKDGEVIGTKVQAGIIDRLSVLKRNTYMEIMLKKTTDQNINLVEEMQKNQLIVVKMPQAMFTTAGEKDIFTTYWMTKIWLALQVRADLQEEKDLVKVNLLIDEIYQVEHTEKFLKSNLSQIAKFGMKPIVSCHYINQLRYMRDELRSANASYMLIAGCDKKNFDELKEELYPYKAEDLKNLKRFHSLNYIKTKDGYAQFITELPKPISK